MALRRHPRGCDGFGGRILSVTGGFHEPADGTLIRMQSSETISGYRRMTPGERLELSLRMTEEQLPQLVEGAPEDVARRLTMLRRENDLRNHNMRVAMARTRQKS